MKSLPDLQKFTFDTIQIGPANIIGLVVFWLICFVGIRFIKVAVFRAKQIDASRKYSIYKLVKYLYFVLAIIISLKIVGIDLSLILAGSAALLVGFGLGIQNLFSDYVSGIIILFDHSVKVNDIIETNGMVCKVKMIKLRTTTVLTRDDKYIILPNTDLTRNQIINWTLNEKQARFDIAVQVEYSCNTEQVIATMLEVASQHSLLMKDPAPFVRLDKFGDSSIIFTLYFWTAHVFEVEQTNSDLRIELLKAFQAKNIKIPYPQRMVYSKQIL